MTASSRQRWAMVLIVVTPALWSVNSLIARVAPAVIAPHLLACLRWLLAGLVFALGCRAELWRHRRHVWRYGWQYLVLGALGMWICGAWVYLAGRSTTALNISLIYSVSPVLIAALAALWLKERLTRWQALGMALAFTGVLHVVLQGQWEHLGEVQWASGDALMLLATLAWSMYSLLLKKWSSPLSPAGRLAVITLCGVLLLLPFALWEVHASAGPALTLQGLQLVLLAAALPGYAAYLAYSVMQRELGAARVSVSIYLGPLWTAAMAWLLIGEPLHGFHAVGLALVLPGVFLVTQPPQA